MLIYLVALFISVPLVELAVLIRLSRVIDIGPTIALVVVTGVIGASLARYQGLRTWRCVRTDLAQGRIPADKILDGLLILVAGVLLITPGIITDTVGFCLLTPPLRAVLKRRVADHLRSRVIMTRLEPTDGDVFVDVEPTSARDGDPGSTWP